MKPVPLFTGLSDHDLLEQAQRLARHERKATAALIACLAEVDARRLYLGEGCSSLFAWCTEILHLSRDAAYGRIEAARLARRFPIVLELLASGSVSMTVVALLGPHLTEANHRQLLADAHHKSKRDIEHVVAALAPKVDVPSTVRKLPTLSTPTVATRHAAAAAGEPANLQPDAVDAVASLSDSGGLSMQVGSPETAIAAVRAVSSQRPVITPLAPERYKIQFTVDRATHDNLRRAQDLLRHVIPTGDPAAIFDRALTVLVAQLERQKWGLASRPGATPKDRAKGRTIPAGVRRAVSRRDDGRCAFVGASGRCTETGFLEFHHVIPFAHGGAATEENIQLRCRAHNQYEASRDFPHMIRERPTYDGVSPLDERWLSMCG